jgi:adenosine deaminase
VQTALSLLAEHPGLLERLKLTQEQAERVLQSETPYASLSAFIDGPYRVLNAVTALGPEALRRIAFEAAEDAYFDRIRYVEFRISPFGLGGRAGIHPLRVLLSRSLLREGVQALCDGFSDARMRYPATQAQLILSIPRNELGRHAEHFQISAIEHLIEVFAEFQVRGVAGIDLTGKESGFPPKHFATLFQPIIQRSIMTTIHAGETDSAQSVLDAITLLGASRIGHGIRVIHSQEVMSAAMTAGIVFEVCPTSNVHTSAVESYRRHPIKEMLARGLLVTVNTDNPTLHGVTLSEEYEKLLANGLLEWPQVGSTIRTAVDGSFLAGDAKTALLKEIDTELREMGI